MVAVSSYVLGSLRFTLVNLISFNFQRMQNDPVVSKASELLRLGGMPSPDELRNGKVGYHSFVQRWVDPH